MNPTLSKIVKTRQAWNKGIKATGKQLEGLKLGWSNKEGEKNPMWKGDEVNFKPLHAWIKSHKPKPEFCEDCKKVSPYDLANISGKYKRDINDFEWLCRKCHMIKDGRLEKFYTARKNYKPVRHPVELSCLNCGKIFEVCKAIAHKRKTCSYKCMGQLKSKNRVFYGNQYVSKEDLYDN